MKLNREQIEKAIKTLEGAKVMVANRDFKEFQMAVITAINALSLIRELTEENEKLKYTSLTSITMEQALTRIRRLQAEKKDIVHKTLARVKIRCSRASYPDMAVPGVMHEIFTIKGEDLDEIEKELSQRC